LAEGGIAIQLFNSSFVLTRWQHKTDSLATISSFAVGLPQISPFPGCQIIPLNTLCHSTWQMAF